MKRRLFTESGRALILGSSGTSMQAVMIRCSGAYSKLLDASSLSCADITCLVATKIDWIWPRMERASHGMSHDSYIGICECAAWISSVDCPVHLHLRLVLRRRK